MAGDMKELIGQEENKEKGCRHGVWKTSMQGLWRRVVPPERAVLGGGGGGAHRGCETLH